MKRASLHIDCNWLRKRQLPTSKVQATRDMQTTYKNLIDNKDESDCSVERNHRFSGSHFDEHIGGWVSDHWVVSRPKATSNKLECLTSE